MPCDQHAILSPYLRADQAHASSRRLQLVIIVAVDPTNIRHGGKGEPGIASETKAGAGRIKENSGVFLFGEFDALRPPRCSRPDESNTRPAQSAAPGVGKYA